MSEYPDEDWNIVQKGRKQLIKEIAEGESFIEWMKNLERYTKMKKEEEEDEE